MKVAIYARVSLDETDPNRKRYQEPENQLEPLRTFAKGMKWEVYKEYVDRCSGGDSNRPSFKEMLSRAKQRRFNGVLVWALDRFSRESMSNTLHYIDTLKKNKIFLRSYTESWLDTSSEGVAELILAIFAWVAKVEREKISRRTKAGIARLKNIGQYKGGRPKKVNPPLETNREEKV